MNMGGVLYRNCFKLVFLLLLTSSSTSNGFQFQTNDFFVGVKLLSLHQQHHHHQQQQLPSSTIIRTSKSKLTTTRKNNRSPSSLHGIQPYGKGAEVWPEPSDEIIRLEDTFPLEQVALMKALYNNENNSNGDEVVKSNNDIMREKNDLVVAVEKESTEKDIVMRKRDKILNLLIQKSGVVVEIGDQNNMNNNINGDDGDDNKSNKFPIVVGITLLCSGLVMPMDVLFTFGFSIYLKILHTWNRIAASTSSSSSSMMSSSSTMNRGVIVPSLPSQGHIPALVSNPLGNMFSNSPMYKYWLIIGAVLGLIAPSLYIAIFWGVLQSNNTKVAAGYAARPLFLFCCQAITEAVSRRVSLSSGVLYV